MGLQPSDLETIHFVETSQLTMTQVLLLLCIHAASMHPRAAVSPEASVYGKRDGYITGLAVVSKDCQKGSVFRGTPGWKTGTIHDVDMLSRANMYKPEATRPNPSFNIFQSRNVSKNAPEILS